MISYNREIGSNSLPIIHSVSLRLSRYIVLKNCPFPIINKSLCCVCSQIYALNKAIFLP